MEGNGKVDDLDVEVWSYRTLWFKVLQNSLEVKARIGKGEISSNFLSLLFK